MHIVPRKPQALAIAKAVPALRKHKRALVVLATALGKTIASALIAKRLKAKRVLFLVHNNHILDNSLKEYRKVFGPNRTYALYNGISKHQAETANFVFASLQTMGKNLRKWRRDYFDLIVVDESQHSRARSYEAVIKYFTGPRLGITATPNRADLLDIRKLFGQEVINISLEEAIAKGWLPPIEYHVVTDDGFDEEALAKISKEVLEENRRISLEELNRRVFIKARDKKVASIIESYDKPTLVFCRNIPHANNFKPFLKRSATFHSKTGGSQKDTWQKNQKVLNDLREGKLRRVLAVDAFDEGVDVPAIELIVFLRIVRFDGKFRQKLGRGCRAGKNKLIVLDFVGNIQRLMLIKKMMEDVERYRPPGPTVCGTTEKLLHLSGKGFEFTFSDELVDLMKVVERIESEFYPTWQEASKAAQKLSIKSYKRYVTDYRKDIRLPGSPHQVYHSFPGYSIFLGNRQQVPYDTWQKASKASLALKISNKREYEKRYREDPKLPGSPLSSYKDCPSWKVFLKKSKVTHYPTWQSVVKICKKHGISSIKEYLALRKKDIRLPRSPWVFYKDFPGFIQSSLSRHMRILNPYKTWREASTAAKKLNIQSSIEYRNKYRKNPRLPSSPNRLPNFPGWKKFLDH